MVIKFQFVLTSSTLLMHGIKAFQNKNHYFAFYSTHMDIRDSYYIIIKTDTSTRKVLKLKGN